jgi:hypothetical protein
MISVGYDGGAVFTAVLPRCVGPDDAPAALAGPGTPAGKARPGT